MKDFIKFSLYGYSPTIATTDTTYDPVIMKESLIQKKIADRHKKDGWFVTKIIQTTTNGIPDLMLIRDGRVVFIEVKAKGKTPAPLQQYMINLLQEQGVHVYVTDDPEFELWMYSHHKKGLIS